SHSATLPLPAALPILAHQRLEASPLPREAVLPRRWPRVEHPPLEQARVDELRQACGERCRRYAPERVVELVETHRAVDGRVEDRSEEHTSELQSRFDL